MSQHVFESVRGERRVTVCMGWDAPLRHYFMVVTYQHKATTSGSSGEWPIYSNLGDPDIEGGTGDIDYYWRKLHTLGIACPRRDEIDAAIRADASLADNNRFVTD